MRQGEVAYSARTEVVLGDIDLGEAAKHAVVVVVVKLKNCVEARPRRLAPLSASPCWPWRLAAPTASGPRSLGASP